MGRLYRVKRCDKKRVASFMYIIVGHKNRTVFKLEIVVFLAE